METKASNATMGKAGAAAATLGGVNKIEAARERTFDELDVPEQIQALRRTIQIERERANSQQQIIERLIKHSHAADGTLMIPAFEYRGLGAIGGQRDPLA